MFLYNETHVLQICFACNHSSPLPFTFALSLFLAPSKATNIARSHFYSTLGDLNPQNQLAQILKSLNVLKIQQLTSLNSQQ